MGTGGEGQGQGQGQGKGKGRGEGEAAGNFAHMLRLQTLHAPVLHLLSGC